MLIKLIIKFLIIGVFFSGTFTMAQDKNFEFYNTFAGTRVLNGHSVHTQKHGSLQFIIQHRFGRFDEGIQYFYGLDFAEIRLGVDYGITPRLTVGFGRSSLNQTLDTYLKYRLLTQQKNKSPLSITAFTEAHYPVGNDFSPQERLGFTTQLMIARKFNDFISLQLTPGFIHRNHTATNQGAKDILSTGIAGKFQITKSIGINAEYFYLPTNKLGEDFNGNDFLPPASIGVDIKTGGHLFQLHFTNSQGIISRHYLTQTSDNLLPLGNLHFGFNITRKFQLRGKKY